MIPCIAAPPLLRVLVLSTVLSLAGPAGALADAGDDRPGHDPVIDQGTGEELGDEAGTPIREDPEQAPEVPLDAFFGDWAGTGVAEDADPAFFAVMARDIDVQITPISNGFRVAWQTLIRSGEDTSALDSRLRAASLDFEPVDGQPWLYRARSSTDMLEGGTVSWARLHGRTLSVYQMTLNAHGGHEFLIFDRLFEDLQNRDRLTLEYRRLTDGHLVRVVRGHLRRADGEPPADVR